MAYSIDPISANCYPGTTVLINKFDIHNEATLSEVEGTLTAAKSAQWLNASEKDTFDIEHYKAIHRFLFIDLYDVGQVCDKLAEMTLQSLCTSFITHRIFVHS